jgi:hypothetical protein
VLCSELEQTFNPKVKIEIEDSVVNPSKILEPEMDEASKIEETKKIGKFKVKSQVGSLPN